MLESILQSYIKDEADKLIKRYHKYHNRVHLTNERKLIRKDKIIKKPDYWKIDKKFNPFYVRRKYKSIAKSIALKISNGTYQPAKPYIKKIPKSDGKKRVISIYNIPDSSVSKYFYSRLLEKNKHRFSSFSYAYRNDRNVHFAIQDISIDLSNYSRCFVAEFDFSDFFGSISHDFLKEECKKNGFFISSEEYFIIDCFLKSQKKVGIPQGTSISLFLANLCCWSLDRALEDEGVRFARYADDTIIWSDSYQKICNAQKAIYNFSKKSGVNINNNKSDGISVLSRKGFKSEVASKKSIDFLGYSICMENASIKEASVKKIKKQISYILYKEMIQPFKHDIPKKDIYLNTPPLLKAITQIRRYMYGDLNTSKIKNYLAGRTKKIYFKGVMSFYPLANDEKQLIEIDGWLLSVIIKTIKTHLKILKEQGIYCTHSPNETKRKKELLMTCKNTTIYGKRLLEIPSFLLIYKALEKSLIENGIEKTMNPQSIKYEYKNA